MPTPPVGGGRQLQGFRSFNVQTVQNGAFDEGSGGFSRLVDGIGSAGNFLRGAPYPRRRNRYAQRRVIGRCFRALRALRVLSSCRCRYCFRPRFLCVCSFDGQRLLVANIINNRLDQTSGIWESGNPSIAESNEMAHLIRREGGGLEEDGGRRRRPVHHLLLEHGHSEPGQRRKVFGALQVLALQLVVRLLRVVKLRLPLRRQRHSCHGDQNKNPSASTPTLAPPKQSTRCRAPSITVGRQQTLPTDRWQHRPAPNTKANGN